MTDTLVDVFLAAAARRHDRPLFVRPVARGSGHAWEPVTGAQALADVEALALALAELGVRPGDRVALVPESRYEWPVVDLATLALGAVLVPIYPTLTAQQVHAILENAAPRVLVVSTATQLAKVRDVLPSLPIPALVSLDAAELTPPHEYTFEALRARGRALRTLQPGEFRVHASHVRPDDLATIIYTSGTTGEPKGVMLTHANIVSNVDSCLGLVDLGEHDVALSFLPLCHIFERMGGLYAMLRAGATIAYARSIDSVAVDVVEVQPTVITGVPRFYEKVHARVLDTVTKRPPVARALFRWGLAQGLRRAHARFAGRTLHDPAVALADALVMKQVRARMGGRLRLCISGGAALDPKTMEFFFAIGIPVLEGYGLTETSPVICLNPPGRERPGSVGPAVPGVEVAIGDQGEILTRGPHVMRGYYGDDAATARVITDGWFHTGDVGRLDSDGYLFITDRLKDLLVLAGGKKVAPQPIEMRLKQSPLVAECVLLGDKRPYVIALVVPNLHTLTAVAKERHWNAPSPAALAHLPEVRQLYEAEIAGINATLAPFETLKRFALLDEDLTQENGALTATLKVKRRVVADRYAALIESLYSGHRAG